MSKLMDEIRKLSPDERRALLVEIQSSLDEDGGGDDDLTPAQRAELDRRIRKYENDPDAGSPLEDVLARIEARRKKA